MVSMKQLCDLPGFEKCFGYVVDENGNVYSRKTKKWMSQQTDRKGYKYTILNVCGKRTHFFIHRLVWAYHKGQLPEGKQINHIDGNKKNNQISNLEAVTGKENIQHAYALGLRKTGRGSGKMSSVRMLDLSGNEILLFDKIKDAASYVKRDSSHITKVCKGKARTCGGYRWQYALDGAMK